MPNPYGFAGYMRYSYAGNNPLAFVDPSGHVYGEPEQVEVPGCCRNRDGEWDQGEWGVFLFEGGYDGGSYIGAITTARPEADPPETVTVTAPRYIPPNYKTLLPPLPLPWNLPIPNFQFDQDGGDSESNTRPQCHRFVLAMGNTLRSGAHSANQAATMLLALGGATLPEGTSLIAAGGLLFQYTGPADALGATMQSFATGNPGPSNDAWSQWENEQQAAASAGPGADNIIAIIDGVKDAFGPGPERLHC